MEQFPKDRYARALKKGDQVAYKSSWASSTEIGLVESFTASGNPRVKSWYRGCWQNTSSAVINGVVKIEPLIEKR